MYNLKINGKRVTNLRLSGENVAKIFTGVLTQWNDPAIAADNPGLVLPARTIVPVVRSDGSGSSAQFTKWMISQFPQIWNTFCSKSGRAPACGFTSFYPTIAGMISQGGDLGIAGYVSQGFAEGAIGYVNYSYALGSQFPVAKVLNAAGFYTEPTPENVAVSLLKAKINTNANDPTVYLTQDLAGVYVDKDPRNYQLSSYSYLILPTVVGGQFNEQKGRTLGAFAYYAMCQAQQQSASLGYSPMPINLVEASFDQIRKIPGVVVQDIDITSCKNPTFAADGSNLLADRAPQPKACDQAGGTTQCADGTGGLSNLPTAVAAGAGSTGGSGATTGGGTGTGSGTGSGTGTGTGAGVGTGTGTDAGNGTGVGTGSGTDGAGTDTTDTLSVDAGGVTDGVADVGCDPDTGTCQASDAPTGDQSVDGVAVGPVIPTALDQQTGVNSLALILFVVALVLGLVLAPALVWRYFANKASTS